ncbi:MAG TPA: hypothetical protein VHS96_12820, partial [Bacteroidia bacterium]|nr:hypothetical protein [Bacteroidia bacterium]
MRKALLKYLSIALLAFIGLSPLGNLLGQQPAYFILGEEEFKGLQIYDVIQDSRKNYLFSTNEGIYLYDYQRFEKIGCPEAKSNSVFNFAANRTGTIFCCNLNHQIFSIRDRQCSLLYELKDDEVSSNVSLAIGPNDELIAGSKKIIRIDANGKVLHRFFYNSTYWGLPFHLKNGDVIYSLPGTDSVLVIGSDQLTFRRLRGPSGQGKPNGVLSFLRVADQGYAVDLESKALFAFDEEDFQLRPLPGNPAFERSKSLRIYPVGDNTWTAGTLPGAFCLNSNLESGKYPLFYENYFISDIFQDHEGNILLSTFDNGVLVVPDLSIPDAINSFRDDPITAIHVDQETGTLYLGSSKGQLMQYSDHQLKTLHDSGMRAIETMVDKPGFPYLLYDNGSILALDKRTGESQNLSYTALKDAVIIDAQTVYLGTNVSLIKCTWDSRGNTTTTSLPGFNFRIHMLEFEKASRSLIASTSHGLFRIDSLEKSEKILLDGKDIFPTAMTAFNENVI